ncbi:hypothetical protein LCGC14_1257140 [marine sediment metagenome]|uniref:Uncharacterized protein n=1 Tax=marine sediment metagenome TaxID=412755 RepID=A0A0F9L4L5_9ZZZZ
MAGIEIITNHPLITAFLLVGGFAIWKFIIQPTLNEGKPLNPTKEEVDGFKLDLGLEDN